MSRQNSLHANEMSFITSCLVDDSLDDTVRLGSLITPKIHYSTSTVDVVLALFGCISKCNGVRITLWLIVKLSVDEFKIGMWFLRSGTGPDCTCIWIELLAVAAAALISAEGRLTSNNVCWIKSSPQGKWFFLIYTFSSMPVIYYAFSIRDFSLSLPELVQ